MCLVVDLFQAASSEHKWLICLFALAGAFSFTYWFIIVPLFFEFLKSLPASEHWVQHWITFYFALTLLVWSLLMFILVGVWYLCRNRAFRKAEDPVTDALVNPKEDYARVRNVNEKVRHTLGLDQDLQQISKAVLQRKASKPIIKESNGEVKTKNVEDNLIAKPTKKTKAVKDLELSSSEITPLPEYSPEASSSIFDFSEESTKSAERERSRSPFREFLHLVQVESPGSPDKTFENECLSYFPQHLDKSETSLPAEGMYDVPLRKEVGYSEDVKKTYVISEPELQVNPDREQKGENEKDEWAEEIEKGEWADEELPARTDLLTLLGEELHSEHPLFVISLQQSEDRAVEVGAEELAPEKSNTSEKENETNKQPPRKCSSESEDSVFQRDEETPSSVVGPHMVPETEEPRNATLSQAVHGSDLTQKQRETQDYVNKKRDEESENAVDTSEPQESQDFPRKEREPESKYAAGFSESPDQQDFAPKGIENVLDNSGDFSEPLEPENNKGSNRNSSEKSAENVLDCTQEAQATENVPAADDCAAGTPNPVQKPPRKLTRKESTLFLGNVGKSQSVLSEMFLDVMKGSVVPDSAVVTGRHVVLTSPRTK